MKRLLTFFPMLLPILLWAQNYAPFHAPYMGSVTHSINQTLTSSDTIALTNYGTIYSLSINATILQPSEGSFVRIVLEDIDGHDYLVAESDWFRNDTTVVALSAYCEETAMLEGITPVLLKCYLTNATLSINSIITSLSQALLAPGIVTPSELKRQQVQSIVDRINTYNDRHGKYWKAGITQRNLLWYENRDFLGNSSDPYISNMIYYIGGLYEIGEPSYIHYVNVDSAYVDSFDWRNRHGKDWITVAKNQRNSNWCSVFATISAVEAMTNLFFNDTINLDLSEQDVANNIGFTGPISHAGCSVSLNSIKNLGVIDEDSYKTTFDSLPTPRPNGIEKIYITGYKSHSYSQMTADSLIKMIINEGPVIAGVYVPKDNDSVIHHAMCLVGYEKIKAGKRYYMGDEGWSPEPFPENDWRIGQPCWIFKDNYYPDKENFEVNGFMYVYFYKMEEHLMRNHEYTLSPQIIREGHTNEEIVIDDYDGDGYFNWGIGPRPSHCPTWTPEEPDGDDSDYMKGPMNEFGHCMELDSLAKRYIYIDNDTILSLNSPVYNHYVLWKGAEVIIAQDMTFNNDTKLIVDKNSTLIIDGATLSNVTLLAQQGSNIVMKNNGKIIHRQTKDFIIPIGSTFELRHGSIE